MEVDECAVAIHLLVEVRERESTGMEYVQFVA